jgi:hypothetical protein
MLEMGKKGEGIGYLVLGIRYWDSYCWQKSSG